MSTIAATTTTDPIRLGAGLRQQLGQILVRRSMIDRHQLDQAMTEAELRRERLGETLLRLGWIYPHDLAAALAEQYGLRYIPLDHTAVDRSCAPLLAETVARQLMAVPLRRAGDRVWIAVSDPTDIVLADKLRMVLSDAAVELVVADLPSIRTALDVVYGVCGVHLYDVIETDADEVAIGPPAIEDDPEVTMAPAVEIVNALLRRALELRASDLHFIPRRNDLLIRARIDGVLRDLDTIPRELRAAVTLRLKVMGNLDISERRLPQDGRVSITVGDLPTDLRIAVLPAAHGENVTVRLLYLREIESALALEELGMDEQSGRTLRRALRSSSGAVIVAGPTGSGKTSTLYSAIRHLHDGTRSIVTIEDPVEYTIPGIVQVEVNPKAGLTFAGGLRTILRADPDVILIGEIRDAETADIAFQAAMTGHLVLSTIHADSTAGALVRLREMNVDPALLGSAVRCVLSQRLFRVPCEVCSGVGTGCDACGLSGYRGRVAAFEGLGIDDAVRGALCGTQADIDAAAQRSGLRPLPENALELVVAGRTTTAEVLRVCGDFDDRWLPTA